MTPRLLPTRSLALVAALALAALGLAAAVAPARAQGWIELPPLPTPRTQAAVAVLDGRLYVIGGRGASGHALGVVERYDPATGAWSSVGSLREPRYNAAAAVRGGRILLMGGREGGGVTEDVEAYNPSENRWESFDSMEAEREGLGAVALGGRVYALGGSGRSEALRRDVEAYDGDWNAYPTWTLGVPRASFAAVPVGEGALVVGGYSTLGPLADVEFFVPGAAGVPRAPLSEPRGGLAGAATATGAVVAGGRNAAGTVLARVDVYDPAADAWRAGPPLPAAREGAVAAVVNGQLVVAGGRDAFGALDARVFGLAVATAGEGAPPASAALALGPPAPNPTAGAAALALTLGRPGPVRAEVLDALGRRVAVLADGPRPAGAMRLAWDGRGADGARLPAGVYVVVVRQGDAVVRRALTLVR